MFRRSYWSSGLSTMRLIWNELILLVYLNRLEAAVMFLVPLFRNDAA